MDNHLGDIQQVHKAMAVLSPHRVEGDKTTHSYDYWERSFGLC